MSPEFSHAAEDVEWLRQLAPGVYVHQETGTLHVEVGELLEAAGYQDTPENRDQIVKAARDTFARLGIPMEET